MKQLLTFLACICIGSINATIDFASDYRVSDTLKAVLDEHRDAIVQRIDKVHASASQKNGVWQFDWLPGYYVKYGVQRIVNKHQLDRIIAEENLTLLHTPKKYLYHIKGRPEDFKSCNYAVIAKAVTYRNKDQMTPLSYEHTKQFVKAIERSGHCSTFIKNQVVLPDGRLSIIDTDGTFSTKACQRGLIRLLRADNLKRFNDTKSRNYILRKLLLRYEKLGTHDRDYVRTFLKNFKRTHKIKDRDLYTQIKKRIEQ